MAEFEINKIKFQTNKIEQIRQIVPNEFFEHVKKGACVEFVPPGVFNSESGAATLTGSDGSKLYMTIYESHLSEIRNRLDYELNQQTPESREYKSLKLCKTMFEKSWDNKTEK